MHPVKPEARHNSVIIESRVVMLLDPVRCLLDTGRQARRALSCLVELKLGDLVLAAQSENTCHVLHVLERGASAEPVAISVDAQAGMSLRGRRISIHALESIDLCSARDASVTAASGNLSLSATNLFVTISESFVQQSRHFIGKAAQYFVEVRHLLKLHGQDALITADRDIKADAQRISMG